MTGTCSAWSMMLNLRQQSLSYAMLGPYCMCLTPVLHSWGLTQQSQHDAPSLAVSLQAELCLPAGDAGHVVAADALSQTGQACVLA